MLELGKAGSAGCAKGELPVLRDGAVVAVLRASNWKEAATAVVGDREWAFAKRKGELTARWAEEPEDVVRMSVRQKSWWSSEWTADLEGRPVEVRGVSWWKTGHRYLSGDRQIALGGTTGGWSPRPTLGAEAGLPLHQQVFLLWLELVVSRRNNAAIAGGAGVAAIGGTS